MTTKKPIIMDVDTGVDDSLAMLLAAASDKIEVKAFTTVFGNRPVEVTTHNTLKVAELLGLDAPVAKGDSRPYIDPPIDFSQEPVVDVHGKDGLGNVGHTIPEPTREACTLAAAELMAKVLRESDEKVTIVATAPLTNIATFLVAYPNLHEKIECIAFMGGAAIGGNAMPSCEANIWHDPDAAQVVMQSGVKLVMFGLDATMGCFITDDERAQLKANGGKVGEFMCNCLQQYAALYQNLAGLPGAVLHDSLPLAWVLDESVAELEHHYVEVALDGHLTRGETVVDRRLQLGKAPNCYVAMRADRDKLIAMHLEAAKKFG